MPNPPVNPLFIDRAKLADLCTAIYGPLWLLPASVVLGLDAHDLQNRVYGNGVVEEWMVDALLLVTDEVRTSLRRAQIDAGFGNTGVLMSALGRASARRTNLQTQAVTRARVQRSNEQALLRKAFSLGEQPHVPATASPPSQAAPVPAPPVPTTTQPPVASTAAKSEQPWVQERHDKRGAVVVETKRRGRPPKVAQAAPVPASALPATTQPPVASTPAKQPPLFTPQEQNAIRSASAAIDQPADPKRVLWPAEAPEPPVKARQHPRPPRKPREPAPKPAIPAPASKPVPSTAVFGPRPTRIEPDPLPTPAAPVTEPKPATKPATKPAKVAAAPATKPARTLVKVASDARPARDRTAAFFYKPPSARVVRSR